jgi:hypothetical protein
MEKENYLNKQNYIQENNNCPKYWLEKDEDETLFDDDNSYRERYDNFED